MRLLSYARTVFRHRWFVLRASWRMGCFWRGLVHDLSKFRPDEFLPYAEFFNGGYKKGEQPQPVKDAFDFAWLLHQKRNPHHWLYWILSKDDGSTKLFQMPETYVREMVADWIGAGMAYGNSDTVGWYLDNRAKMQLHPETRKRVEELLSALPGGDRVRAGGKP